MNADEGNLIATRPPFRRPLGLRGRRALLWTLAFFVGSQLALSLVLERRYPEMIDPEFGIRLHKLRARMAENPGHPLVLILGSSRTGMGIRPDALPALPSGSEKPPVVFNYSLVGASHLTQLMVLNRLRDRGIQPDKVLIEVWQPNLSFCEEEQIRRDRGLLACDLVLASRQFGQPWPIYGQYLKTHLVPAFLHRHQIQDQWLPFNLSWKGPSPDENVWSNLDGTGWLPYPVNHRRTSDYPSFEKKQRERFTPFLHKFQPCKETERVLVELLGVCQRRKIAVVLVLMPEASDFRGYYSTDSLTDFRAYLAKLSRDHAVPCIDARTWVADEDFVDGFHLVAEGASRFTERFGREALEPFLQGKLAGVSAPSPLSPVAWSSSGKRFP